MPGQIFLPASAQEVMFTREQKKLGVYEESVASRPSVDSPAATMSGPDHF